MAPYPFQKVAVYCGSNSGNDDAFHVAADLLAKTLAESDLTLVYGGGKVGLMGLIANSLLLRGGKVIGVITEALIDKEVAHMELTELHRVGSMHERKALMAEQADAFILFPGGPGSWEEFFEIITWAKLGYHQKPCGILNVNGYYDDLLRFLDHSVEKRFLSEAHRRMILVAESPQNLLNQFAEYQAPQVSAWM